MSFFQECLGPTYLLFCVVVLQLRQNSSEGKVSADSYHDRVHKLICHAISDTTEVACLRDVGPGHYLIVPCTWKPHIEMKFLLRVFTDVQLSARYETVTYKAIRQ